MPTAPFTRPVLYPKLYPAAPIWIVRDVVDPTARHVDAVEIVFIGHANRAELDAAIERLAAWPWAIFEEGGVEILADSHADPIGIRITYPTDLGRADRVREILINLFSSELVAHAFSARAASRIGRAK